MPFRSSSRLNPPRACRIYRCRYGRPLFFQNSACLGSGAPLGYADAGRALSIDSIVARAICQIPAGQRKFIRRCRKFEFASACDRIFPARENKEGITLCLSCRLKRTIPDLSVAENGENWRCVELAKWRPISSLVALGLANGFQNKRGFRTRVGLRPFKAATACSHGPLLGNRYPQRGRSA